MNPPSWKELVTAAQYPIEQDLDLDGSTTYAPVDGLQVNQGLMRYAANPMHYGILGWQPVDEDKSAPHTLFILRHAHNADDSEPDASDNHYWGNGLLDIASPQLLDRLIAFCDGRSSAALLLALHKAMAGEGIAITPLGAVWQKVGLSILTGYFTSPDFDQSSVILRQMQTAPKSSSSKKFGGGGVKSAPIPFTQIFVSQESPAEGGEPEEHAAAGGKRKIALTNTSESEKRPKLEEVKMPLFAYEYPVDSRVLPKEGYLFTPKDPFHPLFDAYSILDGVPLCFQTTTLDRHTAAVEAGINKKIKKVEWCPRLAAGFVGVELQLAEITEADEGSWRRQMRQLARNAISRLVLYALLLRSSVGVIHLRFYFLTVLVLYAFTSTHTFHPVLALQRIQHSLDIATLAQQSQPPPPPQESSRLPDEEADVLADLVTGLALTDDGPNVREQPSKLFTTRNEFQEFRAPEIPSSFDSIPIEEAQASFRSLLASSMPQGFNSLSRNVTLLVEVQSQVQTAFNSLRLTEELFVGNSHDDSIRLALDAATQILVSAGRLMRSVKNSKSAEVIRLRDEILPELRQLDQIIDVIGAYLPKPAIPDTAPLPYDAAHLLVDPVGHLDLIAQITILLAVVCHVIIGIGTNP
ncbi:hypothetical protein B0H17DRAFT_1194528 [Mycena rosella]|uniref:Uncharacterized protein n=1 Tax=Mycena rosella TaxID=1033263 RepID=A0AAD7DZR1_MYCRO|nr:hypothetical protein B0H17DRAFT_1194528 [Mycena rosella]